MALSFITWDSVRGLLCEDLHSGGLHERIVFHDESGGLVGRPESGDAYRVGRAALFFAREREFFRCGSRGFGGLRSREVAGVGRRDGNQREAAKHGEVVTGRLGFGTGFGFGRFVGVASVRAFPCGSGSEASADGIRREEAAVPQELAREFAFVGIVRVVHLADVRVVADEAAFEVSGAYRVGHLRVDVRVSALCAVGIVAQDYQGEHRVGIGVRHVGIDVDVSAANDDGLFSGDRELVVSRSRARSLSRESEHASRIAVDRGCRKFAEVVVVDVFGKARQGGSARASVIGRERRGHRLHVLSDVGLELVLIHRLGVHRDSGFDRLHEIFSRIRYLSVRGEFLTVRLAGSESGSRHRCGKEIERRHAGSHVEVRGVVSGGRNRRRAVGQIADGVVFEQPGQVRRESHFSKTEPVRIRADLNGLVYGLLRRDPAESRSEEERNLFQAAFRDSRMRSKVALDRHVREVAQIRVVPEVETVFRRRERMAGRIVLER